MAIATADDSPRPCRYLRKDARQALRSASAGSSSRRLSVLSRIRLLSATRLSSASSMTIAKPPVRLRRYFEASCGRLCSTELYLQRGQRGALFMSGSAVAAALSLKEWRYLNTAVSGYAVLCHESHGSPKTYTVAFSKKNAGGERMCPKSQASMYPVEVIQRLSTQLFDLEQLPRSSFGVQCRERQYNHIASRSQH